MLVYGDHRRTEDPRAKLAAVDAALQAAEATAPGLTRHDLLTRAFLEAADLAQGLADAEFEARGEDDHSPVQDAAMALVLAIARKLAASWWSGFEDLGDPAGSAAALTGLALPAQVRITTAEGSAFYALYPEAYLEAAAGYPWPTPPLVIGLRSIGTGLAAMVAAAAGSDAVVTLRPGGHPFHRKLRISEALQDQLAAHEGPFAVVDEGPGLSGSSFGAVADLLQGLGVASDRVIFLPSHRGELGREASPEHRERWERSRRLVTTFDELNEEAPIQGWFTDIIGQVEAVEDLSAGVWRATLRLDATRWPPANAGQERRKFRLRTAQRLWLARFAGLGAIGEAKLARARALHAAGFTPEPVALRRGFLLESWEDGRARGLDSLDRSALIEHLGRYLGFRCAAFPAEAGDGATPDDLRAMARINAAEVLDGSLAEALTARLDAIRLDDGRPRPIHVDARLHPWEWLARPDGRVIKTDAVDHSAAHDLVGCQDVAWDVAGAAVEFDLSPEEMEDLGAAIASACGVRPDSVLLALFEVAYPAFQVGYWRMAHEAASRDDQLRIAAHAQRYAARLARLAGGAESAE